MDAVTDSFQRPSTVGRFPSDGVEPIEIQVLTAGEARLRSIIDSFDQAYCIAEMILDMSVGRVRRDGRRAGTVRGAFQESDNASAGGRVGTSQ